MKAPILTSIFLFIIGVISLLIAPVFATAAVNAPGSRGSVTTLEVAYGAPALVLTVGGLIAIVCAVAITASTIHDEYNKPDKSTGKGW